ncbi:conserved protein of unknown function [Ectopseudomonas oleovorans]|uniref:Uncharacterized protein n=1 Tax=Ectopseudomonas oleovorans TaxID=301 RepID=A0A653B4F7_ECTOL|nr:conserved protein of unknown function [Pseudomonas oleovorans]
MVLFWGAEALVSTLGPSIQRVFSLRHCTRTIESHCPTRDACLQPPEEAIDAELEEGPGQRASGRVEIQAPGPGGRRRHRTG